MAIGSVGSFATVTEQNVDFGKMYVDTLDKVQAEKELQQKIKAAKAAKRATELTALGDVGLSGIPLLDQSMLNAVNKMKDDGNIYAIAYQNGDSNAKIQYQKIQSTIARMGGFMKGVVEESKKSADLYGKGFLNKEFYEKNLDVLKNLSEGDASMSFDENGDPLISVFGKDKEGNRTVLHDSVPLQSFLNTISDVPPAPTYSKDRDTFVANHKQDETNIASSPYNSEYNKEMTERLRVAIASEVKFSDTNANMAHWLRATTGEYKGSGFTDEERVKYKEFAQKNYEDAYPDIFVNKINARSGGSGGGSKDIVIGGVEVLQENYKGVDKAVGNIPLIGSLIINPRINDKPLSFSSTKDLDGLFYDPISQKMHIKVITKQNIGTGTSGENVNIRAGNAEDIVSFITYDLKTKKTIGGRDTTDAFQKVANMLRVKVDELPTFFGAAKYNN